MHVFRLAMPSSAGWRLSSPDTWSKEEEVWVDNEVAPPEDEPTVPKDAEDDPDKEGTPHEDEEQVHGEAEGDLDKAAEQDPVGEANVSK